MAVVVEEADGAGEGGSAGVVGEVAGGAVGVGAGVVGGAVGFVEAVVEVADGCAAADAFASEAVRVVGVGDGRR